MNPDLEKYIQPIIELHKNGTGNRYEWTYAPKDIEGFKKTDREALRLGMIEMGIIREHPAGQNVYTLLVKFDFDLLAYKAEKQQEKAKKWYDTQNAKNTYDDFPKVKKRAEDALIISRSALAISGLLALLTLIKWICSGI